VRCSASATVSDPDEAHLLPGALMRNADTEIRCARWSCWSWNRNPPSRAITTRRAPALPVAHGEGQLSADERRRTASKARARIAFRYAEGDKPQRLDAQHPASLTRTQRATGMMPHTGNGLRSLLGGTAAGRGTRD
jgi:phosphoribosylformylglycinamidine synthase